MRADNTAHLITAAKRRHELARSKAIRALRELADVGAAVSFQIVAARAQVSRSWLYAQPDIKAEIQRLRDLGARPSHAPIPARQRSTEASLLRRLEIANSRIRELAEDNQRLRRQLAQALGGNRVGNRTSLFDNDRPSPPTGQNTRARLVADMPTTRKC